MKLEVYLLLNDAVIKLYGIDPKIPSFVLSLSFIGLLPVNKLVSSIGAMLTGENFPQVSNLYTCTQTQEADSYYLYAFWCTFRTCNMFWRFKYLWVVQKVPFQAVNEEILKTPNHVCFQPFINNFHPKRFTEMNEHCNLSLIKSNVRF